ncbi:NADPH:quinone oxidoreductase MdaB [Paraliobacillus ryukyuensis]|uniref:Modulator of drug activity B n=1 Tax=Paraliobacillus ryukyuensis TaxID=200904 RepID=A0A366EE76_9BACI|nr:NAD(P)H-dependent oxidoreductase [Paraliobacillus ryukyuensis]RBP00326.1 modulator of drug activity B [Paraliobacillus ryukyuensis]
MKHILLINGHQWYPHSKGELNQTIFEWMKDYLKPKFELTTTIVDQGYEVEAERKKFLDADVVIYQTPIFWFSLPGSFKLYFDQVLNRGTFFDKGEGYGQGGLLTNKYYMLSTTWSAPFEEFANRNGFFGERDIEDVLAPFHYMHDFIGMKPLKGISIHSVFKELQLDDYKKKLQTHLTELFHL